MSVTVTRRRYIFGTVVNGEDRVMIAIAFFSVSWGSLKDAFLEKGRRTLGKKKKEKKKG